MVKSKKQLTKEWKRAKRNSQLRKYRTILPLFLAMFLASAFIGLMLLIGGV